MTLHVAYLEEIFNTFSFQNEISIKLTCSRKLEKVNKAVETFWNPVFQLKTTNAKKNYNYIFKNKNWWTSKNGIKKNMTYLS